MSKRTSGQPEFASNGVRTTIGLMYLLGGLITVPVMFVVANERVYEAMVLSIASTSILVGLAVLWRRAEPLSCRALHAIIAAGILFTSAGLVAWGSQGRPLFLFYFVAAPYAAISFPRRGFALHAAITAISLALALPLMQNGSSEEMGTARMVSAWFAITGLFILVGFLVRQITNALQEARDEQRKGADRFETVMNYAPVVLWQTDRDGVVTFVSGSGLKQMGIEPEQTLGRPIFEVVEPGPHHAAAMRQVLGGKAHQVVTEFRGRVYSTTINPVTEDDDETVCGMIGLSVDVTEKRDSEVAYQAIVETTTEGVWVMDEAGITTYVNSQMCSMLGYSHEEIFGRPLVDFAEPSDADGLRASVDAGVLKDIGRLSQERRLSRKDGSKIWTSMSTSPLTLADGTFKGSMAIVTDITERKASEEDRERSAEAAARRASQQEAVARLGQFALEAHEPEEVMREAVKMVASALQVENCLIVEFVEGELVRNLAGIGIHAARQFEWEAHAKTPVGLTRASGKSVTTENLIEDDRFGDMPRAEEDDLQSVISVMIGGRAEPFGAIVGFSQKRVRFDDQDVRFIEAVANVLAGVEHRHSMAIEAEHQSLHDPLTGLPNRSLLLNRLAHGIRQSRMTGEKVAVILLDLDEFKLINDSHGHQMGDLVLKELAPRLREELLPTDTLARLGGDEFVIVRETMSDEREAVELAERLAKIWNEPLSVRGTGIRVSACIGISTAAPNEPPKAPGVLLRDADAAMYRAKERGRGEIEVFDAQTRTRVLNRLRTESDLHRALERDELVVAYQPIVEALSGEPVGLEALLRWRHPRRGLLPPLDFIPAAEDSGLIVPIGAWVLERACCQIATWNEARGDLPPLFINVNISGRQFAHGAFPGHVQQAIESSSLDPSLLGLEITESVLMQEADRPGEVLSNLKGFGVHLVLDDFGTGYSSLSYLHSFPLDILKVDRSFISTLGSQSGDTAIVTAIITMAQALGLEVIAEGVETPSQLAPLIDLGCTRIQGFHFSKPMLPEDCSDYLGLSEPAKIIA